MLGRRLLGHQEAAWCSCLLCCERGQDPSVKPKCSSSIETDLGTWLYALFPHSSDERVGFILALRFCDSLNGKTVVCISKGFTSALLGIKNSSNLGKLVL